MATLRELVAAFRAGELNLPALLAALDVRGAVDAAEHAAEATWLGQQRDSEGLDPDAVRAVLAKLASLQSQAAVTGATAGGPTQGGAAGLGASSWERVAGASEGESAAVGMLLKGRFQLERELGRGGMGIVYLARDERKVEARDRDPYVAVKVLNDEFRRHPDSLIALQRESRRSQQLAHDNVVRVYDFDKAGTIVFMTMEYINGASLKTLIRERASSGLPMSKARPLIEGMARALERAHAAGVVHSDFKPANVMVTREGIPKVFDFGIARAGKLAGAVAGEQTVFDAGTLGAMTPAYASPEMLRGGEPSPADDVYAFGCVVYELLTGKHPFDKVSADVAQREGRTPPHVRGLSKRQNRALRAAVAFTAAQRSTSAAAVVEGLRNVGLRERFGRPLAYATLAMLVAAGLAWGGWMALTAHRVAVVAAGFEPGNPSHYRDETQAVAAISALSPAAREQLILEHGGQVQRFMLQRVDAYWDPVAGRRDYASAQHVFELSGGLQVFLPQVEARRAAVEREHAMLQHPAANGGGNTAQSAKVAAELAAAQQQAKAQAEANAKAQSQLAEVQARLAKAQAQAASGGTGDASRAHLRDVAAQLLRQGEGNFAQQNYSAAIANAKAALKIDPGNAGAKRLLQRAEQAQRQAMGNISIH